MKIDERTMDLFFYDRGGHPVIWSPDGEHLYTWPGIPVAFMRADKVYAYSGRFLGWFSNGWIYDRSNAPLLFSLDAIGGPVKPVKRVRPVRGVRRVRPVKGVRQPSPARPVRKTQWSSLTYQELFSR
jgi:hypothetical protein